MLKTISTIGIPAIGVFSFWVSLLHAQAGGARD